VARVAELGYRGQPLQQLSWSATVWWADYDRLRTLEPTRGQPARIENLGEGQTRGIEMWARWQVLSHWRLDAGTVLQHIATGVRAESRDATARAGIATSDPRRRYTLRSSHELSPTSQLEWSLRYVSALERPAVPSYRELDLHWIWTPRPNLDVMLSGQNLLHRRHVEFGAAPGRTALERAVLLSAAYRF
jgi:iron complex outermembrane receptor protein